jgi:fused signal recognition particle receptor
LRAIRHRLGAKALFNKLKEKLSGIKESLSTKILEKATGAIASTVGKAANNKPSEEKRADAALATEEKAADVAVSSGKQKKDRQADPADAKKPEGQKPTSKSKVSFAEKAKSLIFEREIIIEEKDLTEPLWDLEMALLESDVALPVAEEIVGSVKSDLAGSKKKIGANTGELVEGALRSALMMVLSNNDMDFDEFVKGAKKPIKILFVGVNGTGKTTSIAKVAKYLKDHGYSVVMAAGDTFRAGAIEQIEVHAKNLDVKLVKHKTGGDPAAVIFDAVEYAKAHNKDVVLADTAGRLHTNINLMDQMRKIVRVTEPDLMIFVDEAIAGNDAVERARLFNESVPISGTILTKTDADAKGGSAISIAYITGKPIIFLGVGQNYPDLIKFKPDWLVERLLGPAEA